VRDHALVDTSTAHRLSLDFQLLPNVALCGVWTEPCGISGLPKDHRSSVHEGEWDDYCAHDVTSIWEHPAFLELIANWSNRSCKSAPEGRYLGRRTMGKGKTIAVMLNPLLCRVS
jgi:hypothetical protein